MKVLLIFYSKYIPVPLLAVIFYAAYFRINDKKTTLGSYSREVR
jgi:hypothetical protein